VVVIVPIVKVLLSGSDARTAKCTVTVIPAAARRDPSRATAHAVYQHLRGDSAGGAELVQGFGVYRVRERALCLVGGILHPGASKRADNLTKGATHATTYLRIVTADFGQLDLRSLPLEPADGGTTFP
jgi:hypothetical protein